MRLFVFTEVMLKCLEVHIRIDEVLYKEYIRNNHKF